VAVLEGDRPKDAFLLSEYSLTAQAKRAVEVVTEATDEDIAYLVSNNIEVTIESLEQAAQLRKSGKLDVSCVDGVLENSAEASGKSRIRDFCF